MSKNPAPNKKRSTSSRLAAPAGRTLSTKTTPGSQPSRASKIFSIVFGVLMIAGMLITAVGGRTLVRRPGQSTTGGSTPSDPNSLALSWLRQGGITGACDELRVTVSGAVQAVSCAGGKEQILGKMNLSGEQLTQLQAWIGRYHGFAAQPESTPTPGVLHMEMVFHGSGNRQVSRSDLQDMERFAEGLYSQLVMPSTPPSVK